MRYAIEPPKTDNVFQQETFALSLYISRAGTSNKKRSTHVEPRKGASHFHELFLSAAFALPKTVATHQKIVLNTRDAT